MHVQSDCGSPPPSPEIGMAREREPDVESLDLEGEAGDKIADTDLLTPVSTNSAQ